MDRYESSIHSLDSLFPLPSESLSPVANGAHCRFAPATSKLAGANHEGVSPRPSAFPDYRIMPRVAIELDPTHSGRSGADLKSSGADSPLSYVVNFARFFRGDLSARGL